MYREKDLQNCLFGLIGFRQNIDPDYPTLSDSLLVSSSGLYVQDEHPLLCIENIDQALKNYEQIPFDPYNSGTTYNLGQKVRFTNNLVYESLQDTNLNHSPTEVDSEWWVEINLFSQKLDSLLRAAGGKVASDVFTKKKIDLATKNVVESVTIFEGSGAMLDKEVKTGRFVGLAVNIKNDADLTAVIRRIGTQFSQANPSLNIYVYHSSQVDPLKVFNLALVKANSFEWSRLLDSGSDYILRYASDDHQSGGYFYIGYYEDDLVGQAINKEYDFSLTPTCASCNNNLALWQIWSKYFEVVPFAVPAAYLIGILPTDPGGPKLWNLHIMQATYSRNYGLNLDLSIRCDVTDFLCRERDMFSQAILKQVSVDILQLLAFSTRNNAISKDTRTLANYELNNKDNNTPGALKKLEKALAALNFDTSGFNSACLPCSNNTGPSWGAM